MSTLTAEERRLSALRDLRILDTPRELTFDRITSLVARLLDVPHACIALVDEQRIWIKSRLGIEAEEFAREPGLCSTTIEDDRVRHVEDASVDPLSAGHSMVIGAPFIRFYVGAPLQTRDRERIGTLCAFGPDPRPLTGDELELVEQLGRLAMHEIQDRVDRAPIESNSLGTILVVDDDEMILTLVRRALTKAGFEALTAPSRAAAIAALRHHECRVHAAILDSSLPESEFVDTLSGIVDLVPDIRLILSGTRARSDLALQFSDMDADFLEKPFGPEELTRIVGQVVSRSRPG